MSRKNGGIIGPANTPVGGLMTGVAGGVWRMNDVLDFVSNSQWPTGPQDIENSLRFNSGSSDYLSRTPSIAGNRKTYTLSWWMKIASIGTDRQIIQIRVDTNNRFNITLTDADKISFQDVSGGTRYGHTTDSLFRDPSAWYHFVVRVDTTQSTDSDRLRIYANNVEQSLTAILAGYPPQDHDTLLNSTNETFIGKVANGSSDLNGYIAEMVLVNGQSLDPTSFGEFDSTTGIWKPKKIGQQFAAGGGAGTNGFYLDFKDSSNLGNDASGNNNDFTVNNLTSIDQSTDTCVENFVTLNPLAQTTTKLTLREGNLDAERPGSTAGWLAIGGTLGVSSGKWYYEYKVTDAGTPNQGCAIGWVNYDLANFQNSSSTDFNILGAMVWYSRGNIFSNGTNAGGGNYSTYEEDTLMFAIDIDNGYCYFGKNGTWENSGDPTSGSSGTGGVQITSTILGTNGTYSPAVAHREDGQGQANFGNPPYSISSGNSDANGFGNFEYSVPSGYYALNTSNLNTYG